MYNATFFEMLSGHTVAEHLGDADRKRAARAVINTAPTRLTLAVDWLHLLRVRTARRLSDRRSMSGQTDDTVRRSRLTIT